MQRIAAENNLPETAFIHPAPDTASPSSFSTDNAFGLRWFTPTVEVPLCGHATLAAAAALFISQQNDAAELQFHTEVSGTLTVSRAGPEETALLQALESGPQPTSASSSAEAQRVALRMLLPYLAPVDPLPGPLTVDSPLVHAAAAGLPVARLAFSAPVKYLLVELDGGQGVTAEQLRSLHVDAARLEAAAIESGITRGAISGVIVALVARSVGELAEGAHVCSRFFGPWMGIQEDPVTGSAHAVLGPYVMQALGMREGEWMGARQLSGRGGCIGVRVPASREYVEVAGQGVLYMKGEIFC